MTSDRESPNVVLVTVDALRADHLGYVNPDLGLSTPTIDDLADESLAFRTAYANAPHTRASFPAIMTGTFPWMYGGYESIAEERPFIAQCFSEAGYRTGGFHSNPYLSASFNYDRGFDVFRSGEQSSSLLTRARRAVMKRFFGERKDTLLYKILEKSYSLIASSMGQELGVPYLTGGEINELVSEWLRAQSEPVFLWLHYMDVHDPYLPHADTVSAGMSAERAIKLQKKMTDSPNQITEEERAELTRLYQGEIEYLDRCLASLLDEIGRFLNHDNTLLAFLSDHGEAFGEHGYYRHPHEFHEEVIRIPFLLRGNNIASSMVNSAVSTVDLLPTLLRYADVPIPQACVGETLIDNPFHEANQRVVFAQTGSRQSGKVMATDGGWKLIVDLAHDEHTLYNLQEDPEEHEDVSNEQRGAADRLQAELDDHLEMVDAEQEGTIQEHDIASDVEARLKELGYR